MRSLTIASLFLPAVVFAQTSTKCNPTTNSTCPSDAGLNKASYSVDFTHGKSDDWLMTYGDAKYDDNGVSFTITKPKEAPTMQSSFYFFFGTVSAVAKASKGTGIVSCFILESDDLDELDWEWLGGDVNHVQTNYFGKGNTTTYNREITADVQDSQNTWHNYTIDWTTTTTTWYIDGKAVRTLNYKDAVGGKNYPQTPMRVKLGIWSASDTGAEGTIEWAGGNTDYKDAPFTMQVKSISIQNANPAETYTYGDETGDWASIKLNVAGATTENATESGSGGDGGSNGGGITIFPSASSSAPASSATKSGSVTVVSVSPSSSSSSSSPVSGGNNGNATSSGSSAAATTSSSSGDKSKSAAPSAYASAGTPVLAIALMVFVCMLG